MKVNKALETPNGGCTFQGELSPEELDYVLEVGLCYLMAQGALPFKTISEDEWANFPPYNGEETN